MSNYDEVTELTWENGQLSMHGLGGPVPPEQTKPLWAQASGTLESIVHQATHSHNPKPILVKHDQNLVTEIGASNAGKRLMENTCELQMGLKPMKKRSRSESSPNEIHRSMNVHNLYADRSTCASASATFCRDTDTTILSTWTTSATGTCSLKAKNIDEDSACHGGTVNQDVDKNQEIIKAEAGQSYSTRRSRVASVHNQSERRRRDKINQKIKALQKLVPNSSKTDKASMLEEVIEYLKRLQAQVHEMMSFRTTPMHQPSSHQLMMMMPAAAAMAIQQQQFQMSLLASMGGMGLGMGMLDMNPVSAACATAPQDIHYPNPAATSRAPFVQPPFVMMTPLMHTHSTSSSATSLHHIHSRPSNSYA